MRATIHFDLSAARVLSAVAVDSTTPEDASPQVMCTLRFLDDRGSELEISCIGDYDQGSPRQGVAQVAAKCFSHLVETQLKIS